jgi:hypothetical protein
MLPSLHQALTLLLVPLSLWPAGKLSTFSSRLYQSNFLAGATQLRVAAALLSFARLTCLLFPALPAATTTRLLQSLTACSALVSLLVARTLARVTAVVPLSAPPRFSSVWFLSVMAVLALASLVSTLGLALFHLSSPATCKRVLNSKVKPLLLGKLRMVCAEAGGLGCS